MFFAVILDLKAFYLLLVKDDDDNFKLGKQGIDVEFCFICNTIRVCRLFNLEGMCFNIVCIMVVVSCKVMKMLHQEGHVLVKCWI